MVHRGFHHLLPCCLSTALGGSIRVVSTSDGTVTLEYAGCAVTPPVWSRTSHRARCRVSHPVHPCCRTVATCTSSCRTSACGLSTFHCPPNLFGLCEHEEAVALAFTFAGSLCALLLASQPPQSLLRAQPFPSARCHERGLQLPCRPAKIKFGIELALQDEPLVKRVEFI